MQQEQGNSTEPAALGMCRWLYEAGVLITASLDSDRCDATGVDLGDLDSLFFGSRQDIVQHLVAGQSLFKFTTEDILQMIAFCKAGLQACRNLGFSPAQDIGHLLVIRVVAQIDDAHITVQHVAATDDLIRYGIQL